MAASRAYNERMVESMNIKLSNGAEPIRHIWSHLTGTGIVLAKWRGELVIWKIVAGADDGMMFHCTNGDYCRDTADAVAKFRKHAARFLGIGPEDLS